MVKPCLWTFTMLCTMVFKFLRVPSKYMVSDYVILLYASTWYISIWDHPSVFVRDVDVRSTSARLPNCEVLLFVVVLSGMYCDCVTTLTCHQLFQFQPSMRIKSTYSLSSQKTCQMQTSQYGSWENVMILKQVREVIMQWHFVFRIN